MNEITQLQRALNALEQSRRRVKELEAQLHQPIAVVGMACHLPGGVDSPEAYWQLLMNQQDAIEPVPELRWPADKFYSDIPQTPGKMVAKEGGFISNIEKFDAAFFGISPREAISMDPQQRLVLKSAWQALEYAGIAPHSIKGSNTGVFVGIGSADYGHFLLKHSDVRDVDAYHATGNAFNVIPGRLSYFFDVHGPSIAVETACSSSLVALHTACQSLRRKECSLAISSGVNVILLPEGNIALSQANMLSPDGRCFSFDKRANGYVRSEGCVTFILKRYDDALNDKDTIYALIKGSAVNHGGKSSGLTVPNSAAQSQLIKQALQDANVDPNDISYVEAHGTGTALGDPIEMNALNAVFAGSRQQPLSMGSVKSNIGHLEAASGGAGLLKVILAMQHQMIPATIHFQTINPMIDLNQIPARIVTEKKPWPTPAMAGVSAFGFSGINAHVVVASCDNRKAEANPVDRNAHILTLSAKDESALKAQKENLHAYLTANPSKNLANIAYSYNAGRSHFQYRAAWVVKTQDELLRKLEQEETDNLSQQVLKKTKCAFLISGQGSQLAGMGKTLYQSSPTFQQVIDQGCDLLNARMSCRFQDIIFSEKDDCLQQTLYTQPAMFLFNYALAMLWQSWGIVADCYLGHSLGEYVAATLAGVISLEDALELICIRASLMQATGDEGSMLVVLAEKEAIEPILLAHNLALDIAIIAQGHTVLSGKKSDLESFERLANLPTKSIAVSHAFHSALMEPMLEAFREAAANITYQAPKVNVISNLTGEFYNKDTVSADYWVRHLRHAVDLRKAMATLEQEDYNVLLEVGPRPTFSGFGHQAPMLYSLRKDHDDWHAMLTSLAELYALGFPINWKQFDADYHRQKYVVPGYPFQEKKYWSMAVDDYSDVYEIALIQKSLINHETSSIEDKLLLISDNQALIHTFERACRNLVVINPLIESLSTRIEQEDKLSPVKHIVCAAQFAESDWLLQTEKQTRLFLNLVQTLLNMATPRIKLWLITKDLNKGTLTGLAQSPLIGMVKCLFLEAPYIDCTHLDVSEETSHESILKEIQAVSEEKQVFFDATTRYVPRLQSFQSNALNKLKTDLILPGASYVITGGQGALAQKLIAWYAEKGAKHLVLLSRRPATQETQNLIQEYQQKNISIECVEADVADGSSLAALFSEFGQTRPPLKGLVHAAGVLDDGLILNQTWERFALVYEPKVTGTWNLHELSLDHDLDHFVLFSSMASVMGTPGQSNYAAANAFLDGFCQYRSQQNLPILTINWGPWADVGMAKNTATRAEGLTKLTPEKGISLFNHLMELHCPRPLLVAMIDWEKAYEQLPVKIPFLEKVLSTKSHALGASSKASLISTVDMEQVRSLPPEEMKAELIKHLQLPFKHILKLDSPLSLTQNFFELGMDSLMAIELRNSLQQLLGSSVSLSQTLLFEVTTLDELLSYVMAQLSQQRQHTADESLLTQEEQLLTRLDELSEDDIDKLLEETLENV
jgi:acyl transferase domain-containing protein/NADP-dependent 3-hydroxy acid dehydrogenase YdfG/acyl carrier protein